MSDDIFNDVIPLQVVLKRVLLAMDQELEFVRPVAIDKHSSIITDKVKINNIKSNKKVKQTKRAREEKARIYAYKYIDFKHRFEEIFYNNLYKAVSPIVQIKKLQMVSAVQEDPLFIKLKKDYPTYCRPHNIKKFVMDLCKKPGFWETDDNNH